MIWSASRSSSFASAVSYITHDKGADTSERVGFVRLENIAFDPREMEITHQAAKMLQARAREQDGKRAQASGRETERPVYHLSLSWHPDEKPSPEHMLETAREVLRLLGLQDHQAVIAQHVERPHQHLHVVASLIHPDTGRTATLNHDHRKLHEWAYQYEERQAMIRSPKREQPRAPKAERARVAKQIQWKQAANRAQRQQEMATAWTDYREKKKAITRHYGGLLSQTKTLQIKGPRGAPRPQP